MEYFMDTSETIPDGMGFCHFGVEHLIWLGICVILVTAGCVIYYKQSSSSRVKTRYVFAALVLGAELFKQILLLIGGRWLACYLPFHLCSVNVFFVIWHSLRPGKMLGNYLYAICLPAAIAAVLFPGWEDLPVMNFMYIHSWALHILLILYPLALTIAGDIRPAARDCWKVILLLLGLAVFFYFLNYTLYDMGIRVNFFFLRTVSKNNPLYIFKTLWGNHLYGLPIIVAAVQVIMYTPIEFIKRIKRR